MHHSIQNAVEKARLRLQEDVRQTPLEKSEFLSARTGVDVFLKLENIQHTGSFKFRGALNKLLTLDKEKNKNGVITASSGNHGLAVARAGQKLQIPVIVYVAKIASPAKIERIRMLGAEVRFAGENGIVAEETARKESETQKIPYISPYNDATVIAGQGTIGAELIEQNPQLDAVFASVGGGGLLSGIGGYLKSTSPEIQIFGCQPENSQVMYASTQAGKVVNIPELPTLSDGTAGGLEKDSITLPFCQKFIDEFILTSEDEIARAMRLILEHDNFIIEGAAGVAVAGFLKKAPELRGKSIAIVICGRNIGIENIQKISS